MGLKCGIIGVTNTGKTSLFNCISKTRAESSGFAFSSNKSNLGMVEVPDERLYKLAEIVKPQKTVPATMGIVDIPGLTKGSSHGEGVGNQFLADIRDTDALIHVVRCFENPDLPHIEGSIDPVRDKETVDLELQVKDLDSVEKKISRLDKIAKSGDQQAKESLRVLEIYHEHLSNFRPARTAPVSEDEKNHIEDLFLLSDKKVLYVCNVDDASATTGNAYSEAFKIAVRDEDPRVLILAARLESEIAELDDPGDRKEFLEDAGLKEPGVNRLIRSAYDLLELQSFFTTGPKEVHAWTIRKGLSAKEAAGIVHSDMEKGFIRAEVIHYEDYVNCGSERVCKEAGKLRLEGKNYIVEDGDVLYIRFNV